MPLFTPPQLDETDDEDPGRPGPNALSSQEVFDNLLDGGPQLDVTRGALPIGESALGGDGSPQKPQPPEPPEFPRMDVPTDAPQPNEDARRQDRIMGLLSALGATAAAAGDDPVTLSVAGGLAQGAAEDLDRRRQNLAKRQQAFQEMVTEAEKHNRRVRQKEIEADYERRLSAFEQDRKDRRQRAQATQGRIEAEREHERELEQIRARGRERRKNAAVRDALEGGQTGSDGVDLPATIEETERMIEQRIQDEQQASDRGATSDELRSIQDDIRLLKQHRDSLRTTTDTTQRDSTAAPADTSRAGRTAPADTTAPDTTTTRGLGRSPGHVSPEELGMKTSGGNPGGGGGVPSSGGARLNADLMGSGDVGARSIESLVDDALTVVWNRGPKEAERRLDGLVNQGHLDAQTARAVRRRMELVRGYDRIAVERSPKAALDSLAADLERGDVTPAEAERLTDRLTERYARQPTPASYE